MDNAPSGSTIVVRGTCTGAFTVGKNLTLVGSPATLDGGEKGTVVTISSGVSVVLTHFAIQDGNGGAAGGILNYGTLTVNSSSLTDNTSSVDGGGVTNLGSTVTINTSRFSHNRAALAGGGVAAEPIAGAVTINSSSISGNSALLGGGIGGGFRTSVNSTAVSGNSASNIGGGILNTVGTITLNASPVSGNSATNEGGGLYNDNGGTATLRASPVFGNEAANGGGIFTKAGTVNLVRFLVFSNRPNNCAPPNSVPGCLG